MTRRAAGIASLCVALLLPAASSADPVAAHDISLRIEPEARRLEGRDRIRLDAPRAVTLLLAERFRIDSLRVDARRITRAPGSGHGMRRIDLPAARRIELRWSGDLDALEPNVDHRQTLGRLTPASAAAGTFLPYGSGWYPTVDGMLERYRLELDLPADQRGLVPGRLTEERTSGGRYRARFEFAQPAEGIALMAGPYRIGERRLRTAAGTAVRLRTYFHAEIAALADGYLDAIVDYLDLYERRIGVYPFSEFSVVSSPTPTGFGMPTLTYLGIEVLRLPFIRATSLGHEVLHNWWGNGVYPDYARGNWSEGLTNFMADYAYREREGAAAAQAARLAWLRDFAAMPAADDAPLAGFTSRTHGASQVVGYNKSAMVFFMLRDLIGDSAFEAGLRSFWSDKRFRFASWDDLRVAFEGASGRKLEAFFAQWLERTGAPQLHIADARAEAGAGLWRLHLTLAQTAPAYALSVPVTIRTAAGTLARRIDLSQERATAVLDLPAEPLQVALDPELRLMRRLAAAEAPPILREAMLAGKTALHVADTDPAFAAVARELGAALLERAPAALQPDSAQLVVGSHAGIDAWLAAEGLAPRPEILPASLGSAQVWTLRRGDGRVVVLVSARDAAALAALARPLPHHGRQSYLAFDGARAITRGVWPSQPQVWNLAPTRN